VLTFFCDVDAVRNHVHTPDSIKLKLSVCLIKHHAMKTYWGVEIKAHKILTSALDEAEWSASRSGRFTSGGKSFQPPQFTLVRRLKGPRSGLDSVAKRKNPITAPAGNRTSPVQPVLTELP
jgi:hypothetical protein